MRPLLDLLCVSREKLSFLVDATAAPIASISPISSWVGFEVDLIQQEIDKIIEIERIRQGVDNPVRFQVGSLYQCAVNHETHNVMSSFISRKSPSRLPDSQSSFKASSIGTM